MNNFPYTAAPEVTDELNKAILEEINEISAGLNSLKAGNSRIALLQAVGRIETACKHLTNLAPRLK